MSRVRTLSVDLTSGPEDVRRDLGRAVEEDEEGFGPVYMLVFLKEIFAKLWKMYFFLERSTARGLRFPPVSRRPQTMTSGR